jgi:hypothetical protein
MHLFIVLPCIDDLSHMYDCKSYDSIRWMPAIIWASPISEFAEFAGFHSGARSKQSDAGAWCLQPRDAAVVDQDLPQPSTSSIRSACTWRCGSRGAWSARWSQLNSTTSLCGHSSFISVIGIRLIAISNPI